MKQMAIPFSLIGPIGEYWNILLSVNHYEHYKHTRTFTHILKSVIKVYNKNT